MGKVGGVKKVASKKRPKPSSLAGNTDQVPETVFSCVTE